MKNRKRLLAVCCIFCTPSLASSASMQQPRTSAVASTRFPYRFNNFVWWSDSELRGLLRQRVPGLRDQIPTTMTAESQIRNALLQILKQKGISGEVMIEDPPPGALQGPLDPGVPPPAIMFRMAEPRVLVDKVIISQAPHDLEARLYDYLKQREGREYASAADWIVQSTSAEELDRNGYIEGKVEVSHDAPRRDGDHYLVNLVVAVNSGPQYHVAHVTGDGGPLLAGRDLSSLFGARPGDLATPVAYGPLEGRVRGLYWHSGYADADVHTDRTLDREHALVSYQLKVTPGPLYHLRSVTIHGLTTQQEARVRELFTNKPGAVFDEMAINNLYRSVRTEPLLTGMSFSFSPHRDRPASAVDLTLEFFKEGTETHVTVN